MEFKTAAVDTMARGTGPAVAQDFLDAVSKQLKEPAYAQSGFSIDVTEFKSCLGYTGSAKITSLVWAVNSQLEKSDAMIRAGVRQKGTRVAFFVWDGKKRSMTPRAKKEDESAA